MRRVTKITEIHGCKKLMRELSMFPDGRFRSGMGRPIEAVKTGVPMTDGTLTSREITIMSHFPAIKEGPYASFMRSATNDILLDSLGIRDTKGFRETKQVRDFFQRMVIFVDNIFDEQRHRFAQASQTGESAFYSSLLAIPIQPPEGSEFSVGEGMTLFYKLLTDQNRYIPQASALLLEDTDAFITVGVKDMARKDSSTLSAKETQRLLEITNGLYAVMLFDTAYANLVDHPNYFEARDKYIATKLAFQYLDDMDDISVDDIEGSANVVIASAREQGEDHALLQAVQHHSPAVREAGEAVVFDPYFEAIAQAAPNTYVEIRARQQELLSFASLSEETQRMVALPERGAA